MSTNSSSPNQGSVSNPKPDNSRQRLIAIAAVIIVALLVVNAFLLISYNKRGNVNAELTSQLDESEQLQAELEKQYYDALSELEEMRGSNEELNALIEQQKDDLKSQKEKISGLIRNKKDFDKARRELKKMTAQVEGYIAEINQLREENEVLVTRTGQLTEQNESLSTDLQVQRIANDELTTSQATLVSEKETLASEKEMLARKINIASVVKVDDLEVTGLKSRQSGKAIKKKYAKNIDQLQICFYTSENEVADPGLESFFVRIISPLGETLAIEELGSGIFINSANGDQIRYTKMKEYEYNQDVANLCLSWIPNQPFQQGNYEVEIYNKGYLAGSTNFTLK